MSYALKYSGTLKDYFNRTVEVKIYELNYTGSDSVVTLSGISKRINGSDDDLFVGKMGSSVTVGLLSTSDFQFIDLYSGNSRKFKMEVYIDSVLDWVGWLIPENFTEPYDAPPYITQVTARDGLGELESHEFTVFGVVTQLLVLQSIFGKIGSPIVNIGVNIYEENHVTTDSPLLQTYVDTNRYEGMNCDEVLNDLLNLWGARVYQSDGEWWFVNVVEFENPVDWVRYNIFGPKTTGTKDTELLIGRPQEDKFANVDQQLNILPAWKEVKVKKELGLRDSILLNYEFKNWTRTGATDIVPDDWTESEYNVVNRLIGDKNPAVVFNGTNASPSLGGKFIFQQPGSFVTSTQEFRLDLSVKAISLVGTYQFWVRVQIWDGGSQFRYLQDNGSWTSTQAFINFQNLTATGNDSFRDVGLNIDGIPIDGSMTVSLYASDNGQLVCQKIDLSIRTEDGERYPEEITDTYQVGDNNKIIEKELLTADFPDLYSDNRGLVPSGFAVNEKYAYTGGLFLDTNKEAATERWQLKKVIDDGGSPYDSALQLDKIVVNSKATKTQLPQWAISGSILSKNIKTDSAIVDYQVKNNKYLVCNGEYDMENCFFVGTYIEIGSYSGAPWILADGTWNDDGIWVDSDQWNDADPTP
jgi:hypothetical protein